MGKNKIVDIRHPSYVSGINNKRLWRLVLESGEEFINKYLRFYPDRETPMEFMIRKEITYVPAFAKSGLVEIKNALFQRVQDIVRKSDSQSYMDCCAGLRGGVDNLGSSMVGFLGEEIIIEMLGMSRVGVFVDAPVRQGETKADEQGLKPYIYVFKDEEILSWTYDKNYKLTRLLLRENYIVEDPETGLVKGSRKGYRFLKLNNNVVTVERYNNEGEKTETKNLNLSRIPFVIFQIKDSLLKDVSKHQIALLQLSSSDVSYGVRSNFAFYTEQFNPSRNPEFMQNSMELLDEDEIEEAETNREKESQRNPDKKANIGIGRGRRYPKGMERPGFINPSSEPLSISMKKQEAIRNEIRQLINLSVANLGETQASADSREFENRGLESGLSHIGLAIERGEREILECWQDYENITSSYEVKYPKVYSLRSEQNVRDEIKELYESIKKSVSIRFRKEAHKRIVELSLRYNISSDIIDEIKKEIDGSEFSVVDPEIVSDHVEAGILAAADGAKAMGYPKETVSKAQKEHADRLKRIQDAQSSENPAARGNPDLGGDPVIEKKASQRSDTDPDAGPKVRGKE